SLAPRRDDRRGPPRRRRRGARPEPHGDRSAAARRAAGSAARPPPYPLAASRFNSLGTPFPFHDSTPGGRHSMVSPSRRRSPAGIATQSGRWPTSYRSSYRSFSSSREESSTFAVASSAGNNTAAREW